jgi:hypothetical protein
MPYIIKGKLKGSPYIFGLKKEARFIFTDDKMSSLKVDINEKEGGSASWISLCVSLGPG